MIKPLLLEAMMFQKDRQTGYRAFPTQSERSRLLLLEFLETVSPDISGCYNCIPARRATFKAWELLLTPLRSR